MIDPPRPPVPACAAPGRAPGLACRWRADAGITLLELVVAMGLFAMVALIGTQALQMSLRMQDRLGAQDAATRGLAQGLSLLRADLAAALEVRAGPAPGTLALRRLAALDPARPGTLGVAQVLWRLDRATATLLREQRAGDAAAPATSVPQFNDVADFTLRRLDGDGWRPLAGPAGDGTPPRAVEALIETGFGPLRVLVVP